MSSPEMPTSIPSSRPACRGLTLFLAQRTALEAGDPIGIDPARDELAFYPLIYWPCGAGRSRAEAAIRRIDAFMKGGGTVLFDTRDAIEAPPRRRVRDAGHAPADALHPRRARAGAGAARARADQDVLPAARLPRPLQLGPDLGRDPAARGGRRAPPPGARRRRRLAHHHHLERSRRRLGDRPRRPADAAADAPASRASANSPSAPASTS